ncbi:MAG: 50S ribosomal protein L7ae [Candidatus Aenigmarchaeota archaeon]|nr:50S ribosomal protein L7ae [Candidatus Aenigmarchaeota archaeon]
MSKPAFVKFEVSKDQSEKAIEAVTIAKASGKLKRGLNEATKAIERGVAKIVIMAEDVTPPEILMHLPVLCEEKEVPFTYVASKEELGRASGIEVPTSAIVIIEEGEAKNLISEIAASLKSSKKPKEE